MFYNNLINNINTVYYTNLYKYIFIYIPFSTNYQISKSDSTLNGMPGHYFPSFYSLGCHQLLLVRQSGTANINA